MVCQLMRHFNDEHLLSVVSKELPWYADITNYLVSGVLPYDLDYRQKKKFLHDTKFYYWEEPLLYKGCASGFDSEMHSSK